MLCQLHARGTWKQEGLEQRQEQSEPGMRAGYWCCRIPLSVCSARQQATYAGQRWDPDPPAWLELPEGSSERGGAPNPTEQPSQPHLQRPKFNDAGLPAGVAVTGTARDRLSIGNRCSFPRNRTAP